LIPGIIKSSSFISKDNRVITTALAGSALSKAICEERKRSYIGKKCEATTAFLGY
jgi:hypothetical protein